MKKILDLFWTFFKIGLFTFGGGYAMISVIENECVNKKNWISKQDMQEVVVLSESTPGPIAIHAATFVGYNANKILGSILATIGVTLPSLIIITLISIFLDAFKSSELISFIFQGVRASVILLMILAILNLSKTCKKNILFYGLILLSFILNFIFNVKAIYIVIFTLLFSFIYSLIKKDKEVNENA